MCNHHDLFVHQGKPGEKGASREPGRDGQKVSVKHQEHYLITLKLCIIILFFHLQGEAGEPGQKGERGLEGSKVCRF